MALNPNGRLASALLAALAGVAAMMVAISGEGVSAQPRAFALYLPDIESNGPPSTATPTMTPTVGASLGPSARATRDTIAARPADMDPHGIESWGDSIVTIQNLAHYENEYSAVLAPGAGRSVNAAGRLGALRHRALELRLLEGVMEAFYDGTVHSGARLGAVVDTTWRAGGHTAVEASEPGTELLMPLMVKTVFSHTTFIYAQNTYMGDEDNLITFEIFDPATGDSVSSSSFRMEPGESVSWDTSLDQVFDDLGESFLGALRIDADEPVAVMAYGDELLRSGSSAYRARPLASADTLQLLPSVRTDATADTMIVVANAGNGAADVTITFVAAADSPVGADQHYEMTFPVAPRGTGIVDLSRLARGNVTATSLPRGFRGSAVISSSRPILALALDTGLSGGLGVRSSAYNAFGPTDMATHWIVPGLGRANPSTEIIIGNAGDSAAQVAVSFQNDDGSPLRTSSVTIGPGASAAVTTVGLAGDGPVRAEIHAPWPVAVVARSDSAPDPVQYWGFPIEPDSGTPTATATASATPSIHVTPSTATPTPTGTGTGSCTCRIVLPWSSKN